MDNNQPMEDKCPYQIQRMLRQKLVDDAMQPRRLVAEQAIFAERRLAQLLLDHILTLQEVTVVLAIQWWEQFPYPKGCQIIEC
jgi:hypothetical protein